MAQWADTKENQLEVECKECLRAGGIQQQLRHLHMSFAPMPEPR